MPPKMRVEKGMIRASRSFHGIDPELQVSSEPLPMPDPGGAEIIIAPSAPSAPEDQIPGPVDGDWEPTLRAFFKQYAPAKSGEVPVYLEHWKGREDKMMAMLSHRYHKPF